LVINCDLITSFDGKVTALFRFLTIAGVLFVFICMGGLCIACCEDGCALLWNHLPSLGGGGDSSRKERREAAREQRAETRRRDEQIKADRKEDKLRLQRAKNELEIQKINAKAAEKARLVPCNNGTGETSLSAPTDRPSKSFFDRAKRSTANNEVALLSVLFITQFSHVNVTCLANPSDYLLSLSWLALPTSTTLSTMSVICNCFFSAINSLLINWNASAIQPQRFISYIASWF